MRTGISAIRRCAAGARGYALLVAVALLVNGCPSMVTLTMASVRSPHEMNQTIWLEPLSYSPRLLHIHGFMSPEEAEHIISLAQPTVKRVTIVGSDNAPTESYLRTSKGMFINRFKDAVVTRLQKRVSHLVMLPLANGEDLQILQYGIGQEYKVHPDFFSEDYIKDEDGWQRLATVIVYLNNVTFGGETIFPQGLWKDTGHFKFEKDVRVSDCAAEKLNTRPMLGDAVIFWSLDPGNKEDYRSYHASCPVVEGEKLVMTTWFHVLTFRPKEYLSSFTQYQEQVRRALVKAGLPTEDDDDESPDGAACTDRHEQCHDWALADACHELPGVTGACCDSCRRYESGELK